MAYITTPAKAYSENESFGGTENIQNLQSAIETSLTRVDSSLSKFYTSDGSLFFVNADTSIFVLNATKKQP